MKDPLKTIESLGNITLRSDEKVQIFSHISAHINETLAKPVPSPFSIWSLIRNHGIYATSIAMLLVIASGSAAAESALPGDFLYSIKRNINEEVLQAFAFDNESKASVQIQLVERRFNEVEEVMTTDSTADSEETLLTLAADIKEHTSAALDHIQDVQTEASVVTAAELSNDLSSAFAAHDNGSSDTAPVAAMMMKSAVATFDLEQAPQEDTLQSIVDEARAEADSTSQNLSDIIITSNDNLVSEDQITNNKSEITDILDNNSLSTTTRDQIEMLVDAANENIEGNDFNEAFILLEEAEKIGNNEIEE